MSRAREQKDVTIEVANGRLKVRGTGNAARLRWTAAPWLEIRVNGTTIAGAEVEIAAGDKVSVKLSDDPAGCTYHVDVMPDRMQASLRVGRDDGRLRALAESEPAPDLVLKVRETPVPAPDPILDDALAALREADVVYGVDSDAVAYAIADPGSAHTVATGREPEAGRDGSITALVDFEELRLRGVLAGTELLEVVPKQDGTPGIDVHGRTVKVKPVRDPRLRLRSGVEHDREAGTVRATIDGLPVWDGESIHVQSELVLDAIDVTTGSVDFCGSITVLGDVGEGRTVTARHDLTVRGSVSRARLQSGGMLVVDGPIVSSVLRAGGQRAVAAGIYDRIAQVPDMLADAAVQAGELRDVAESRGREISHGLSIQLVLERMYRSVLTTLADVADELACSGPEFEADAIRFNVMRRTLATAAVSQLGQVDYAELVADLARTVAEIRRAVEETSDLVVASIQACEAEATGKVTLTGRGIFNSRVVAWGGLDATHPKAVMRGGTLVSHGPVHLHEFGSPGGARMTIQLGRSSVLQADLVHAGTVIEGPGRAHQFIVDRSHVVVTASPDGMDVESLAA